jgi:hypothetical protein
MTKSIEKEQHRVKRTSIANWLSVTVAVTLFMAWTVPARAQSSKNFYDGKAITFLVGSSAGGGTDITARLIARHIERYIPGKPHFHNLCVVDSAFAFFIF